MTASKRSAVGRGCPGGAAGGPGGSALDPLAYVFRGRALAEEIADVQIYLVRLADRLGIDILEAAEAILADEQVPSVYLGSDFRM